MPATALASGLGGPSPAERGDLDRGYSDDHLVRGY